MRRTILLLVLALLLTACAGPVSGSASWSYDDGHIVIDLATDTPTAVPTDTPAPTSTATSTPLSEATPTGTPTATETATAVPTPLPSPTETIVAAVAVPYGAFHNSNYARLFFNSAIIAGAEWERLHEIRDTGRYHVLAAAAQSNPCAYMVNPADGFSWSIDAFITDILARKQEILTHAAGGTLLGLIELNEPHNPDSSQCVPVPPSLLAEAANAFWANFPELSRSNFHFGFWTPPTYLEGQDVSGITLAAVQYTGKGGQLIDEWAAPLEASAASQGMKLIYSANLYQMGVDATVAANVWECDRPLAVMVSMWTDRLISDADGPLYQRALEACGGR